MVRTVPASSTGAGVDDQRLAYGIYRAYLELLFGLVRVATAEPSDL